MKKVIPNLLIIIGVLVIIWFFASWIDVVDGNYMPGNVIHSWNLFELLF